MISTKEINECMFVFLLFSFGILNRGKKDRLWIQIDGRNNRCISYHGREARYPFLDEDVAVV